MILLGYRDYGGVIGVTYRFFEAHLAFSSALGAVTEVIRAQQE